MVFVSLTIRWLGNACVEIIGKKKILIDPNYLIPPNKELNYVLVTHEHPDHFREEAKEIKARFYAPETAIKAFNLENLAEPVKPGNKIGNIEVVESFCLKSKESVGYLIYDKKKILHLGDSFKTPEVETDIVFLPIFKPYHKEIIEAAQKCKAETIYLIHYSPEKKMDVALELVGKMEKAGLNAKVINTGEQITL